MRNHIPQDNGNATRTSIDNIKSNANGYISQNILRNSQMLTTNRTRNAYFLGSFFGSKGLTIFRKKKMMPK
nr:hypothetical protein [Candidatus Sigynarchaeum springense]